MTSTKTGRFLARLPVGGADGGRLRSLFCTLLLLFVAPLGCQDASGDDDEALKRRLEQQAAARPKKASLTIGSIHHLDELEAGEPLRAQTPDGGTLQIEEAYLVVSAVELHACEPGIDDYESPGPPLLNELRFDPWQLVGGTAHAHVPSSATRLGTPFVDDLLGKPDSARIVGEIAPPLAAYCRMVAVIAPADDDVANSTDRSTEEFVGKSLLLHGRFRPNAESDWREVTIASDHARTVTFPAVDPQTGETPLTFAQPGDSSMVLIDKVLNPETFAVSPDADDVGRAVIDRLAETMRVHRF